MGGRIGSFGKEIVRVILRKVLTRKGQSVLEHEK
jgi:hypothetical protein